MAVNMSMYPSLSESTSSVLLESAYVTDGFIIARNFKTNDVGFKPWGIGNNLTLGLIQKDQIIGPLYHLAGNTANSSVGFVSDELDYRGKVLVCLYWGIIKSGDFQTSISFDVQGEKHSYRLFLINGFLNIFGWHGENHYEKNLAKLIETRGPRRNAFYGK